MAEAARKFNGRPRKSSQQRRTSIRCSMTRLLILELEDLVDPCVSDVGLTSWLGRLPCRRFWPRPSARLSAGGAKSPSFVGAIAGVAQAASPASSEIEDGFEHPNPLVQLGPLRQLVPGHQLEGGDLLHLLLEERRMPANRRSPVSRVVRPDGEWCYANT